jgi:hypothetical protein
MQLDDEEEKKLDELVCDPRLAVVIESAFKNQSEELAKALTQPLIQFILDTLDSDGVSFRGQ